jgi:hypothetical protein
MQPIVKLAGIALMLLSFYFLGQNIIFTSSIGRYWWIDMSAAGAVITLFLGVLSLVFGGRDLKNLGWGLLFVAILLVFVSAGVFLKPTSLWDFFLAVMSMVCGWNLFRTGRLGL